MAYFTLPTDFFEYSVFNVRKFRKNWLSAQDMQTHIGLQELLKIIAVSDKNK